MDYSVIILAAGKGSRTQLSYNKVFYCLPNGQTVLQSSLSVFLTDPECKQVVLVCADHEREYVERNYNKDHRIRVVTGGNTRQQSVFNGLHVVEQDYVMIHDGARPFVETKQIEDCKLALQEYKACLLMVPSTDSIKIVKDGIVTKSVDRKLVYQAQTPQCFETKLIQKCHRLALNDQKEATDDAQLVEWYSDEPIKVVLSSVSNKKITLPEDVNG